MLPLTDIRTALYRAAAVAAVASLLMPRAALAAEKDVTLELRPHCTFGDLGEGFGGPVPKINGITDLTDGRCTEFETKDPLTRQTRPLRLGESVDIDIVAHNPGRQDISRFRTWLAFDPTVLEGDMIEIHKDFPTETPGEADFDAGEGYAKVGATADEPTDNETVVLTRVRFTVTDVSQGQTIITFYDAQPTADAHTLVMAGDPEENALALPVGSLLVRFDTAGAGNGGNDGGDQNDDGSDGTDDGNGDQNDDGNDGGDQGDGGQAGGNDDGSGASAASSAAASLGASSTAPVAPPPSGTSLFPQLQVQNLRATTEGTSVYLAWDALTSTELAGYNVYYGTVSGQYIQRRSVDKGSTTLTLRNLQAGRTYYIAVRGVSTSGAESEFSKEVGITVGNPASSTSPLASIVDQGPQGTPPPTDGNLAGDTGLPSPLSLLLMVSAVTGTVLAFRRQLTVATPHA